MDAFREAPRVLTSALAGVEKRTLVWIAERLPRWLNSDHLTGLALAAMACCGLSYWLARVAPIGLLLVVVGLAVNWFGDSLDGTVARVRGQQRPRYGFYVDHVIDCFGATFLFGGMALSGYMNSWIAIGILIAYILLCAEVFLATYCVGKFDITTWGFGPTELRILLSIGNIAIFFRPYTEFFGMTFRVFDVGGAVALVCLVAALITRAIGHGRLLYRLEPLPSTAVRQ
jgi:phosphatidylglycerophosphate synthase